MLKLLQNKEFLDKIGTYLLVIVALLFMLTMLFISIAILMSGYILGGIVALILTLLASAGIFKAYANWD